MRHGQIRVVWGPGTLTETLTQEPSREGPAVCVSGKHEVRLLCPWRTRPHRTGTGFGPTELSPTVYPLEPTGDPESLSGKGRGAVASQE